MIEKLDAIKKALQNIDGFRPTQHNSDLMSAIYATIDAVIEELKSIQVESEVAEDGR